MPGEATELLRRRFHCDPSAPTLARDALRRLDKISPVRDDATLVVSELVTNAVRHSGGGEGDELELKIDLTSDGLTVSVWDVGRSPTSPELRPRDSGPGGLGLHIVAAVAGRWGVEDNLGRRVWAELWF
ncbi:MAG: ATP-binding protein [Solirubrobacteraceae bacterium]